MRKEILQFPYDKLLPTVERKKLAQKLHIEADFLEVRRFFAKCSPIHGIMIYFDGDDVMNGLVGIHDNHFVLSDTELSCDVFKQFTSYPIKSALAYLISCSPDSYENLDIGEMNYHFIQNACMDIVRSIVMQNFRLFTQSEYGMEENIWFSQGVGPGYFGMPVEEGKKIHKLLKGEQIGVTYHGEMMYPLKSSIGAVFSYMGDKPVKVNPCNYCTASEKDCRFCGGML